ncbi:MAG: allophanate hydrolase subunit 2 family protein, partial [Pseudomonadota bacterium]
MKGLAVIAPGVQSTLQATPRSGHRHVGVPSGGAADGLSHALANRLVANDPEAATLEVTFGAVRFRFAVPTVFAVTGAHGDIVLQG